MSSRPGPCQSRERQTSDLCFPLSQPGSNPLSSVVPTAVCSWESMIRLLAGRYQLQQSLRAPQKLPGAGLALQPLLKCPHLHPSPVSPNYTVKVPLGKLTVTRVYSFLIAAS